MKINEEFIINLREAWITPINIDTLINLLQEAKNKGFNSVSLDIEYGYYDDIDALNLMATKE